MGKTISTFLCYFWISFHHIFFPVAFYASVKKFHFCMGAYCANKSQQLKCFIEII